MSRSQPASGPTISLFPFLAVLLCTMGALLVVLVLFSRAVKEGVVADAGPEGLEQELELARDNLAWRVEQLDGVRQRTSEDLARARMQLAGVEENARALQDEMARLERMAAALAGSGASAADEAALKELEARLASARESLDKARADQRTKPPAYAIVPYAGRNGTHRRPLYIECAGDGVFLQPENIRLGPADFQGPPGPGNPLASALRAAREHILVAQGGAHDPAMQPYPLLLVRPSGVMAYYAAREAIGSWGSDFGYQLVDEDWTLAFPPADPTLAQVEKRAIDESRQRLAWLAEVRPVRPAKQPRQYRAAQTRGGVVADEGPSVLGDQSRWDWANGAGDGSGSGSAAGAGGSGRGDGFGNGRIAGGSGLAAGGQPGGSGGSFRQSVFSANANGNAASDGAGVGGRADAGGGSGVAGGDAAGGMASTGSSPAAGANSFAGGSSSASADAGGAGGGDSGRRSVFSATDGSSSAGGSASSAGAGGAAAGTSAVAGASGAGSAASASGGSSGGSGGGSSGPAMPGLATAGGGQPGSSASGSSASASVSMAQSRGKNWASLATQERPIPLTRPIRLECAVDEFRIMDDSGRRVQTRIPIDGDTALAVDPLVKAVHARVDTWGLAGDRMYWKPVLVLSETADGRSRREDLERLLADSGLEARSSDGRDVVRPLPPVERTTAAAPRR